MDYTNKAPLASLLANGRDTLHTLRPCCSKFSSKNLFILIRAFRLRAVRVRERVASHRGVFVSALVRTLACQSPGIYVLSNDRRDCRFLRGACIVGAAAVSVWTHRTHTHTNTTYTIAERQKLKRTTTAIPKHPCVGCAIAIY